MARAKRISVLVVENGSSVSALACTSEERCGVGSGGNTAGAVGAAVRALESGETVAKSEARAILDRADDAWSEDFRRQAQRAAYGSATRRKRRRK